ncbi:DNA sulfur modification protein DndB [Aeromonas sp. s10]|uniref:DNA sulfur modification protein DndB n=1 Tax=Aeromonas sp. s10 TaxID=3138480 RepID=UPI0034A58C4C
MKTTTLLPAIRSRVGDWSFYVTTLTFAEVATLVKAPDEIHERKQLADWIQREAIETHADAIKTYIKASPQRFLGSLIIGVYGGSPDWSPLKVKITEHELVSEEQLSRIEGALGLLHLFGDEKLFAIDGQHRVAGITRALLDEPADSQLRTDCVSAIFVAHDPTTDAGKARTRRLFTTVNKKAKPIARTQTIALDEDNGFAIVTRRLIDTYPLFSDEGKRVLYASTGSLPASEFRAITSVVGLFELVKDLYGGGNSSFDQKRPSDDAIDEHLQFCVSYFDALLEWVPEYVEVFKKLNGQPGDYRTRENNHLLFRPAGQRAFARAVQLLVARKMPLSDAVKVLLTAEMNILKEDWHHVLWNPVTETMVTGTMIVAEAQLLRLSGQNLRNCTSAKRLDRLLESASQG